MTLLASRPITTKWTVAALFATALCTAAAAQENATIAMPEDPFAGAAFQVLERHCARCHQDGRLDRAPPKGDFGNILMLSQIASDPNYIVPGNPDGS
ncbi:MAG: hypothetical protein ACTSYE_04585, partial [Alphaproteobacteria bacterium]